MYINYYELFIDNQYAWSGDTKVQLENDLQYLKEKQIINYFFMVEDFIYQNRTKIKTKEELDEYLY